MPEIPRGVRRALNLPTSTDRLARDLDDEVRFHMEMRIAELERRGMSPEDARLEALRRFGDADDLREYCHSMEVRQMRRVRLREWLDGVGHDVRFAWRQVMRAKPFYLVAIATLALGIGATTSIFTVVRAVLLRPLPFPDADRIVQLWQLNDSGKETKFSDPNYTDVRSRSRSFAALAQQADYGVVSVTGGTEPVRVRAAFVSADFFKVMGVTPIRGRPFVDEELRENGRPAVAIGYWFWQRNFGGAENVIGRALRYGDLPLTIVAIMPPSLDLPSGAEIWVPRELQPTYPSRTAQNWQVVGRLAAGVSVEQARAEVSSIARQLKQQLGSDTWMSDATLKPLHEQIVGRARKTLLILLAGSFLLLLIACANVINLLVARMASRRSEIALRVALGAGRGRIAQQSLAEGMVLAIGAAIVGFALAHAGVKLLLMLQPDSLPRIGDVRIDVPVLLFATITAIIAAMAIGAVAAWRGTRGDLREALSDAQRTQGGSASSERVRRSLVVAQVAMAVVLLVASSLFAHSFVRLLSVDPGFRIVGQVVVDVTAEGPLPARVRLFDDLVERLKAIPGVTHVGAVNAMPLNAEAAGNGTFIILNSADERLEPSAFQELRKVPERVGSAEFRIASAGYFAAMGIPLVKGRMFEDRDIATAPHVAVISASLARTRWPNEDPIGKAIQFGNMDGDLTPFTIVGVVGDVREASLASEPRPTFYGSYRQRPARTSQFNFVLASAEPAAIMNAARRIVRDRAPELSPQLRTIEMIVGRSVADRRFVLSLAVAFGAAALMLAMLGVYSLMSYLVAQRSREIGIRAALGARASDIMRMVVRQGVILTSIGIAVGVVISLGATRWIASMLYAVSPTDPLAFGVVIAALAIIAVIASWLPARRASHVQASDVLRGG